MSRMSQRGYARHAGVRLSYIQRLIQTGVIALGADGRIDSQKADTARAEFTDAGRWKREHPSATAVVEAHKLVRCAGCNGLYDAAWEAPISIGTDAAFCSGDCRKWKEAGITRAEIRRRIRAERLDAGFTEKELAAMGEKFCDWVHQDGTPIY